MTYIRREELRRLKEELGSRYERLSFILDKTIDSETSQNHVMLSTPEVRLAAGDLLNLVNEIKRLK